MDLKEIDRIQGIIRAQGGHDGFLGDHDIGAQIRLARKDHEHLVWRS